MSSKTFRISVNVILVVCFVFFELFFAISLLSQIFLFKANSLDKSYRWRKAQIFYQAAVNVSPYDSRFSARYGDFSLRQSAFRKNKVKYFKDALKLYKRASRLTPHNVAYLLTLTQIQARLYNTDKKAFKNELNSALFNLQQALSLDPNGVNTAYIAGYVYVSLWGDLHEDWKTLAKKKLRYALSNNPWYSESIYEHIWETTADFSLMQDVTPVDLANQLRLYNFLIKNNLTNVVEQQRQAVKFYRQSQLGKELKIQQEKTRERISKLKQEVPNEKEQITSFIENADWQGFTRDGEPYQKGNMYSEGTLDGVIRVAAGDSTIVIIARGEPAGGIFPYMVVELDGELIGEGFVDSLGWDKYSFKINIEEGFEGIKVLSITYINDRERSQGQDRNLYISRAEVIREQANHDE